MSASASAAAAAAAAASASTEERPYKSLIFDASAYMQREAREQKVHEECPDNVPGIGVGGLGLVSTGLRTKDEEEEDSGPVSDNTDTSDLSDPGFDALTAQMETMRLRPFEERPLEFVVQFFTKNGGFLWETQPQTAFPSFLEKYHQNKCFHPLRLQYKILAADELFGSDDSKDTESASAAAAAVAAAEDMPKDSLLESDIPDTGYAVVIIGVTGPDGILIGYHCERYGFGCSSGEHKPVHLDTFRVGGKRVAWRRTVSTKRSRSTGTEDVSTAPNTSDESIPGKPVESGSAAAAAAAAAAAVSTVSDTSDAEVVPEPDGFEMQPTPTHQVWNSAEAPLDVKISIMRNKATQNVETVRLAVNIHIKRVREELRAMFDNPTHYYPELVKGDDDDEVIV